MIPPLPSHFHASPPSVTDLKLVSILLGWAMGFGFLTTSKALRQTLSIWRRTHNWRNVYIWLIWGEILACGILAILMWLMINGIIPFGFNILFVALVCWSFQIQILPQIILNRISLITPEKRRINRLKLYVFIIITLINISIFVVWIPAHMQISDDWERIDNIWDRTQKCIYLVLDLSLNFLFLYTVRTRLIGGGLQKYRQLFWFNAFIIWFSIAMDATIIGMMSLKNSLVYTQFHPVAFFVKLNIELTMADLIAKISLSQQRERSGGMLMPSSGTANSTSRKTWAVSSTKDGDGSAALPQHKAWVSITETGDDHAPQRLSNTTIDLDDDGIKKTVSTSLTVETRSQDDPATKV